MYKISIHIKNTLIYKQWFVWTKLCGYQWPSHRVHPWTTNRHARGFVAKPCPEPWNQSVFVYLGKIPRVLPRGFANGLPTGWSAVIHNAWFNSTCYHAPSPGHTSWDLQFFFALYGLFPIPRHAKRVNCLLLGSWSTSYTIFGVHLLRAILISIQWQNLAFLELL